jgi:hypothetical protein
VGQARQKKRKCVLILMGWKEGSGTAGTYTRRHIENKAREAALLLQQSMKEDSHA